MPVTSEIISPPRRRQVDSDAYANGSLGAFTTIALLVLFWGLCWLKGHTAWRQPQRINVVFHEVAGLNDNAGVFVDGVRVGIVDSIQWKSRHRVIVGTRITASEMSIPYGAKFAILANGVVGAKFLEISLPSNYSESQKPIESDAEVIGDDPVRPELALNNLAIGLSKIDMDKLERNFDEDRVRLVRAADQLAILANKSMPVIDGALPLENEVLLLSKDTRNVSSKLARLLDNPELTSDLKETVESARATMASVQSVVRELRLTLDDKSVRTDIVSAIAKLNDASAHVEKSVAMIHDVVGDKLLRDDLKKILRETRATMNQVSEVLNDPSTDIHGLINKTRDAVDHLDTAAQQVNQILDKKRPLLHMLVGRPGHLKVKKITEEKGAGK